MTTGSEATVTSTPRAVRRFDRRERSVYQTAILLTREHPAGFSVEQLAEALDCEVAAAREWYAWLRRTGDFEAIGQNDPSA